MTVTVGLPGVAGGCCNLVEPVTAESKGKNGLFLFMRVLRDVRLKSKPQMICDKLVPISIPHYVS